MEAARLGAARVRAGRFRRRCDAHIVGHQLVETRLFAGAEQALLIAGMPLGEPIAQHGPFVMNTREEVMQAMADYQAGRLGTIPAVHGAPTTLTESAAADR